jgi:hypothetical protein
LHEELLTAQRFGFMIGTILLIVVILLLLGAVPRWPHSTNWGYGPSGLLSVVAVILLVLILMGQLPF